jgi:DNA excision repair protein ERCC-5
LLQKNLAAKLVLPNDFPNQRVYDAYRHPEVDASAEPFQWGQPNAAGLHQFMRNKVGWTEAYINQQLEPVLRANQQRKVTVFFSFEKMTLQRMRQRARR